MAVAANPLEILNKMDNHPMTRRLILTLLSSLTLTSFSLNLSAKSKKGKGDKDKKKERPEEKKMTGTVIMEEKGITKIYKFLGDKPYSFSKSTYAKISKYEEQEMTLFGTFHQTKVLKVSGVLAKK